MKTPAQLETARAKKADLEKIRREGLAAETPEAILARVSEAEQMSGQSQGPARSTGAGPQSLAAVGGNAFQTFLSAITDPAKWTVDPAATTPQEAYQVALGPGARQLQPWRGTSQRDLRSTLATTAVPSGLMGALFPNPISAITDLFSGFPKSPMELQREQGLLGVERMMENRPFYDRDVVTGTKTPEGLVQQGPLGLGEPDIFAGSQKKRAERDDAAAAAGAAPPSGVPEPPDPIASMVDNNAVRALMDGMIRSASTGAINDDQRIQTGGYIGLYYQQADAYRQRANAIPLEFDPVTGEFVASSEARRFEGLADSAENNARQLEEFRDRTYQRNLRNITYARSTAREEEGDVRSSESNAALAQLLNTLFPSLPTLDPSIFREASLSNILGVITLMLQQQKATEAAAAPRFAVPRVVYQ
jgi:hypothetical protein